MSKRRKYSEEFQRVVIGLTRQRGTTVIRSTPVSVRATLNWAQGSENAENAGGANATGLPVFFCDPGSPWQLSTIENLDGPLRQYFPQSADLTTILDQDIRSLAFMYPAVSGGSSDRMAPTGGSLHRGCRIHRLRPPDTAAYNISQPDRNIRFPLN